MRSGVLAAGAVALTMLAGATVAQDNVVVVELFTSQGCSSCPPADEMLRDMTAMEGVIPLALHVDYWDYIGWVDTFGDARHTARQQAYAVAAGERMVYTPQMIVGGTDPVIGTDAMAVMDHVRRHADLPATVRIVARREGADLVIAADPAPVAGPLSLQVVRFLPEAEVEITRGENAGHRLVYANIVTDWQAVGDWDGRAPLSVRVPAPGDEPAVVLLQEPGPGLIVAAVVLR